MLTQVHHLTINVRSIADAVQRYTAFGLVCLRHTSQDAWMCAPNGLIQLCAPAQPIPNTASVFDTGYTHCCIQTRSITDFMDGIVQTDAKPRSLPVDLGTGHRYVYIDDGDGVVTECEGVPYAPAGTGSWLAHIALATPNLERQQSFYAALTGGNVRTSGLLANNAGIDTIAQHHGIRAQAGWIRGLNLTIELWQFHAPQARPGVRRHPDQLGYASVCYRCDDLARTQNLLAQAGATMDTNRASGTRWFDPDGNCIDLIDTPTAESLSLGTLVEPTIITRIESFWRPATSREDLS